MSSKYYYNFFYNFIQNIFKFIFCDVRQRLRRFFFTSLTSVKRFRFMSLHVGE